MTLLYILLSVVLLICIILLLPLKIVIAYDKTRSVAVKLLFFKLELLSKNDTGKEKPKKAKKAAKPAKKASEPAKEQKKLLPSEIVKLIKDVIKPLGEKSFGYIRIDHYNIKIVIATEDAAMTAILYGAASATLFSLLSVIETFKPSRRSITGKNKSSAVVIPDFMATESSVNAHIIFSIRVWQFIYCAIRGSRDFLLFNRSRKI